MRRLSQGGGLSSTCWMAARSKGKFGTLGAQAQFLAAGLTSRARPSVASSLMAESHSSSTCARAERRNNGTCVFSSAPYLRQAAPPLRLQHGSKCVCLGT